MKQNHKVDLTPRAVATTRLRLAAEWRTMDDARRQIVNRHLFLIVRLDRLPWAKGLVWRHLAWEFKRRTKNEVKDLTEIQRQAQFDRTARDLYDARHICVFCYHPISFADWLTQTPCRTCGAINPLDSLTPDEAQDVLRKFQARRRQLGLDEERAIDKTLGQGDA